MKYSQLHFEATSFYPSAMWDDNSISKNRDWLFFKLHMNDVVVSDFNIKIFNQDGKDSTVL